MTARSLLRGSVSGYLTVVKVPMDYAARLVREDGHQAGPVDIAVDRLDATLRLLAGAALRDPDLVHDARQRRKAADARESGVRPSEPGPAGTEAPPEEPESSDRIQDAVARAVAAADFRAQAARPSPLIVPVAELDELEAEQDTEDLEEDLRRLKDSPHPPNARHTP